MEYRKEVCQPPTGNGKANVINEKQTIALSG
jgi:hypothetical protein